MQKNGIGRLQLFKQELNAYRLIRNEIKPKLLIDAVLRSITSVHTIFPTFGGTEFFEFLLQNTYAEPISVLIEISDRSLK